MRKFAFIFSAFLLLGWSVFALEATVVSVVGRVEIQHNGEWFALSEGEKIEKSTVISTGFKSRAVLEFKGTTFAFEALTRGTIQEIIEEENFDSASLFIDMGKVSAIVNTTSGRRISFKVGSPVAVSSVRGTSFTFTADGKLTVERGIVHLALPNAQNGVNVYAGQQSEVELFADGILSPEYSALQFAIGRSDDTTLNTSELAESIGYTTAVIMYYATEDVETGGKANIGSGSATVPTGDATFSFEY